MKVLFLSFKLSWKTKLETKKGLYSELFYEPKANAPRMFWERENKYSQNVSGKNKLFLFASLDY